MTKLARSTGFALAITYIAGGCAAPGYNPPEGPRAAERCPVNEVWVCEDRYPSRLENENEPPMFCRCEDIHGIR